MLTRHKKAIRKKKTHAAVLQKILTPCRLHSSKSAMASTSNNSREDHDNEDHDEDHDDHDNPDGSGSDDSVLMPGPAMHTLRECNGKSHQDLVNQLIESVLTSSSSAGASSSTVSAALAETKKGLKCKRPAVKVAGERRTISKSKGKGKAGSSNIFGIKTVAMNPNGVVKTPTSASLKALHARSLASTSDSPDGFLFSRDMVKHEIMEALRDYLPSHCMEYIDSLDDTNGPTFFFCQRVMGDLVVSPWGSDFNGNDLFHLSRNSRHCFSDSMLVVVTKDPVPEKVLRSWQTDSDLESSDASQTSDDGSDEEEEEDAELTRARVDRRVTHNHGKRARSPSDNSDDDDSGEVSRPRKKRIIRASETEPQVGLDAIDLTNTDAEDTPENIVQADIPSSSTAPVISPSFIAASPGYEFQSDRQEPFVPDPASEHFAFGLWGPRRI
ncbi:hypothetical protein D9758_014012 [Tetrapyrgos nigripes]|uniref:Uncharacterized protein n=1 Tax=Tetrapyrgos nigripes TaxID=182062 RepID=A0A8H5CXH8_9AGAR|nr:hypothetical protein D9758_014012 [Tetrapyrgos nigripes]